MTSACSRWSQPLKGAISTEAEARAQSTLSIQLGHYGIVGVVDDVRATHAAPQRPSVYLPLSATGFRIAEFARLSGGSAARVDR
jgi:hypothetical protein